MKENLPSDYLQLEDIKRFFRNDSTYILSETQLKRSIRSFEFLREFSKNKVIYGINTGFGPMAQYRVVEEDLKELQYNLIRSHANGTGDFLSPAATKIIMICRLNTLALGFSGTSPEILETLASFIGQEIFPLIPQHGGVGASGDLVQLAHLTLGLIGEGKAYYKDEIMPIAQALKVANLKPSELQLRDGLSLINGTSCMSGLATINLIHTSTLLHYSILASSVMNELTASYTDSFSEELNGAKLHSGQQYVARKMRGFLADGNVLKNRHDHLFNEKYINGQEFFSEKVQEYYSLRCVPQIIGPIYDTFLNAKKIVEEEINSANDNPIVCADTENVYHGGNFHGDYISFEMDKLKIGMTKLSMLMERQINYLMNDRLNNKFPAFLNMGKLGFNFGLQGMQFTAVSTTAENQSLSTPVYIHSIPNNGDNQDIVSMGTNSALMAERVINNTFEVLSVQLVAIAQAIDIDQSYDRLSSSSKGLYDFVREELEVIKADKPNYEELARLKAKLLQSKEGV
ncbi:aromatic amino acid ammonia-lyase [Algoriphagus sp. D3-2-R+10]|uniref:HAL/PAL/TAL family ammonia-lyase n=1 Tax=Algoriphagus aurantiacus TaxID=3103948 RepID=UPI002B36B5F3|nr:aromatic amino acid ammonia-lyase [Algoriphagus sp. D3-2-R+10]MEB2777817.1 aromatic amino acid ammonia-lyase [Algoriphagus sp. D3-2-R+10]